MQFTAIVALFAASAFALPTGAPAVTSGVNSALTTVQGVVSTLEGEVTQLTGGSISAADVQPMVAGVLTEVQTSVSTLTSVLNVNGIVGDLTSLNIGGLVNDLEGSLTTVLGTAMGMANELDSMLSSATADIVPAQLASELQTILGKAESSLSSL